MMSARHTHNRGFVLLMVLLVLTICGTILAAAARRSGQQALRAGQALREVQVRWGSLSCKAACLPTAEVLLRAARADDHPAPVEIRRSVKLGTMTFGLLIADEQAKANANRLAARGGSVDLAAALRTLQVGQRRALQVLPRPAARSVTTAITSAPMLYAGPEQLFSVRHPSELVALDEGDTSALSRITCWGSGRINLKRAELRVLRQSLAGLATETQLARLVAFRGENPDCTLGEMLGQLELTDKQSTALRPHVTDTSNCHSLWVVAEGATRSWHRLYVEQLGDGENDSQAWTFRW